MTKLQIWIEGDEIKVTVSAGNTISVPLWKCQFDPESATQKGWLVLCRLLRDQEQRDKRIGTPASPTQWNLDQAMKSYKGEITYGKRSKPDLSLDDLMEMMDG